MTKPKTAAKQIIEDELKQYEARSRQYQNVPFEDWTEEDDEWDDQDIEEELR